MLYVVILVALALFSKSSWAFRCHSSPISTTSRSFRLGTASRDSAISSKKVVVVGATGYIGKFVVNESVKRGYNTVAVARPSSTLNEDLIKGSTVVRSDVTSKEKLYEDVFSNGGADVVISCLASRSGVREDAYRVDYEATLNTLEAARAAGVKHFILLSAYCVRKPLLQFQNAKLKFEKALVDAGSDDTQPIRYTIVRPTAFFKSVSGQLELLQQGWPFVMFGDGKICKCNPIAESDLAAFMLNSIEDSSMWNKIMDVGGPDEGMTMKEQGDMMFEILGKEPKFIKAPVAIFDAVIGFLEFFGKIFPSMEDAAELGRIGKYYAVEDMLTSAPSEKFGTVTLRQHYERIAVEGQEYDPYTTMLAKKK